jgi:hypothetical protein
MSMQQLPSGHPAVSAADLSLGDSGAEVAGELYAELHQLVGAEPIPDSLNGAANIHLIPNLHRDGEPYGRWGHGTHRKAPRALTAATLAASTK